MPAPVPRPFLHTANPNRIAFMLALTLLSTAAQATGNASPIAAAAPASSPKSKTDTAPASHPHQAGKPPQRPAKTAHSYAQRSEARVWAQEVATQLDLPLDWIEQQLAQARRIPAAEKLVLPAPQASAKNWAAYRARFIEPRRIQAGMAFWQRHEHTLARAQAQYGVPASLIVGVLGVETLYGQHTGTFRVLDVLATLAFDFPSAHPRAAQRQAFFRAELGHFLRLSAQNNTDPTRYRGSYAGAMGLAQFMPSSWLRYAVDFDQDGQIDLLNQTEDAIGSVANYFSAFGWKGGMPTHYSVQIDPQHTDLATLLAPDILPTFSPAQFQAKGAALSTEAMQHNGLLALIALHNGPQAPSYVAGTENFYTVTRYNWSSYYAMAVIELGQAVEQALQPIATQASAAAPVKPSP